MPVPDLVNAPGPDLATAPVHEGRGGLLPVRGLRLDGLQGGPEPGAGIRWPGLALPLAPALTAQGASSTSPEPYTREKTPETKKYVW
jgi:hypothetical protein